MPVELNQLTSTQLEALPRGKTVFFFSVGPLEDHGSHLPLGMDVEEASYLCQIAARKVENDLPDWASVIMPRVPLGIESNTTRIALTVRPHVLRDWLVDSCRSLMRLGFAHFVCFSGHLGPRQLTAIEEAGRIIRNSNKWTRWSILVRDKRTHRPTLISASSAFVTPKEVLASPFWPDPKEHGGKRDTSVALAISENLVDPSFKDLPNRDRLGLRWSRNLKRRQRQLAGYWGNPSHAESSTGAQEMEELIAKVFPKFQEIWKGARPDRDFKSWYSVLPPNKSFFKAWLLVLSILVVVCGWALLTALTFQFS